MGLDEVTLIAHNNPEGSLFDSRHDLRSAQHVVRSDDDLNVLARDLGSVCGFPHDAELVVCNAQPLMHCISPILAERTGRDYEHRPFAPEAFHHSQCLQTSAFGVSET